MATAETVSISSAKPVATPDLRIRLSGVSWETFEGLARRTRGGRLAYDRGELEIMSPSLRHEDHKGYLREFVRLAVEELGGQLVEFGSATWKAPAALRGIEADESYYFDPTKIEAVSSLFERGEVDVTLYPPLDLVIEIDMSRPELDRQGIYAAIGACEVWRFDGDTLIIERLNSRGTYDPTEWSGLFPVRAEEISDLIGSDMPTELMARSRLIREWIRRELVPRAAGG